MLVHQCVLLVVSGYHNHISARGPRTGRSLRGFELRLFAMDGMDELSALAHEAVEAFEALLKRGQVEQPPEQPLACRAGCAHCCYQPEVTVTAIELFRVADYVVAHFSPDQIATLTSGATAKPVLPTASSDTWVLRACPLLVDGACSVYEARPLVCRSINSYAVSDCERARRQNRQQPTIRTYGPQERAGYLTLDMLQQGIAATGREAQLLNLAPALAIALSDDSAKQRWLDGEQVFEAAWATL